jgi:hypothetical protein
MGDDAVRVHGPLAAPSVRGGVAHCDRPAAPRGLGEHKQDGRFQLDHGSAADGEVGGLQQRVQPTSQRLGQHTLHLGRSAFGRGDGRGHQARPTSGDQPQQHGERLVIGEHEGRHAVLGR